MATNGTNPCKDKLDLGFNLLYLTVPINVIIVCKSILVIVAVSRTSSLHTNMNILIASMSAADLVMGATFTLFGNFQSFINELGDRVQRVITNFMLGDFYSSIVVSVLHNGVIAIDQYINIAHPFYYMKHMTRRWTVCVILCAWIIGLVFLFVPMVAYTDDRYHQRCIMTHSPVEYYLTATSLYVVTSIAVLIAYFRIASLAFSHKRAAHARRLRTSDYNADSIFKNNFTAALRSVKFFVLMFGGFSFCTLQPVIVTGLDTYWEISKYFIFAFFLVPLNTILRFAINFYMNKNFSKAVKSTFSDLKSLACRRCV